LLVIEGVEEVGAEFEIGALGGPTSDEALTDRHVSIGLIRPTHNAHTQISKSRGPV
jgi:hypothetical protein